MKKLAFSVLLAAGLFACSKPKAPEPAMNEGAQTTSAGTSTPATGVETDTPALSEAELADFTVYFDYDSWTIRPESRETLTRVGTALKNSQDVRIQIEGHCDERGSNEYNLALGERRARTVQDFLTAEGVSSDRLSTISYGEERPAVQGSGENVWAQNRRAEFKRL